MTGSMPNWEQHDEAPRFAAASRTPSEQWGQVVSSTERERTFRPRDPRFTAAIGVGAHVLLATT
jgi:hypothetical protein